MTLFDLLFITLFLAAMAALIAAAVLALRGRRSHAWAILRTLALASVAYVAVVAVVGVASPQRVLAVGDPWCFDDWCLTVESAAQTPVPPVTRYRISLRLFSRARRVSQRASGTWIYLVDSRGNRYAPEPESLAVPLDVLLGPGESVQTSRTFNVPAGVGELGLITGHGGPSPAALVIADEASLLHKPTFVRLR